MDLISDVLGLIVDKLGTEISTLLTKKIRGEYFRKNGISLRFIRIITRDIEHIPNKFREYSINFSLKGLDDYEPTDENLVSKSAYLGSWVGSWIINSTIILHTEKLRDLSIFPNLQRVKKLGIGIDRNDDFAIILGRNIKGCGLIIQSPAVELTMALAEQIKKLDCDIIIRCFSRETNNNITDKLDSLGLLNRVVKGDANLLLTDKFYPRLKTLIWWYINEFSFTDKAVSENFPKLRKVIDPPAYIDDLKRILPQVEKLRCVEGDKISEDLYKKWIEYNYSVRINVVNDPDEIALLNSCSEFGTDNIELRISVSHMVDLSGLKTLYKKFNIALNNCCRVEGGIISLIDDDPDVITSKLGKIKFSHTAMTEEVISLCKKIYEERKKLSNGSEKVKRLY